LGMHFAPVTTISCSSGFDIYSSCWHDNAFLQYACMLLSEWVFAHLQPFYIAIT